MKLKNMKAGNEFLRVVYQCKGHVELRSQDGDVINLKSMLSKYLSVAKLLDEHGNDLELYCSNREDENMFKELMKNGTIEL